MATTEPRYRIVHFDEISPVSCPCGQARRALADAEESYFILDCGESAKMELDGQLLPVRKGSCILIPPGVVHRAVGNMTVLIVVVPKFDPDDEVIVEG